MRKTLASALVGVLSVGALAFAGTPPAQAAPSDGSLTVRVVIDDDLDSKRSPQDLPLGGAAVTLTDDAGATLTKTSDASGVVTWSAAENTLSGGKYRLAVANPDTSKYSEATLLDGHAEPQFAPAVSFVDLGAGDQDVSVGFIDKATIGVDASTLYSATQRNDIWQQNGPSSKMEVYSVPWDFNASLTPTTITTKANLSTDPTAPGFGIGTTYGVGTDGYHRKIYLGAYAKRGALYGPGGPGAIYRVDPKTGATELYATVADAGTTEHKLGENQDLAFRTAVGRESLGDVEVSLNGKWLSVLNLNTDSVVTYPIQDGTDPAPAQTLKIAPQGGCAADWTPFALEEKDGITYIGATCGGTGEVYIISYERGSNGALNPTGEVVKGNSFATADRPDSMYGPNRNLVTDPTNANKTKVCWSVKWLPWTDEVPAECVNASYGTGATVTNPDGTTSPRYQDTSSVPAGQANNWVDWAQFVVPQPVLADMELTDAGWVLSFRDRGSDQYGTSTIMGQRDDGKPAYATYIATGDIVSTKREGDTLTLGTGAKYNDTAGNIDGSGNIGYGAHYQGAFAGIAYIDGQDKIAGNQMDASAFYTNGMRQYDINTGLNLPTTGGLQAIKNTRVTNDFSKGAGLADLEVMVRYATQQIGNRIWIDTDRDGVQDPSETPVAGVQVSLYDAEGKLVATTETDANGEYSFDVNDGVKPGVTYEVRLDRAADFRDGGPLEGYLPTEATSGSDTGIDSDGTPNGEKVVVASVTTAEDGSNDHSIDFGFVPVVSIGNKLWIDQDGDGQQDADEPAVPEGTEVKLLDADGNVVATTKTDANGSYVFVDLIPATDYVVEFPKTVTLANGDVYALTAKGTDQASDADSNADQATGKAPVTTPATGKNSSDPAKVDDPTIDAGYAPLVSLGDYLWIDANGDGVQDADEAPVPAGTEVKLLDAKGDVVATTTTDADGYYAFTDLPASTDFVVEFPTKVTVDGTDYVLTQQAAGGDESKDSNPEQSSGKASVTTAASGKNSAEPGKADTPSIDAGYWANKVSIGDYLWIDADGDGIQGADEKPVAGVEVKLLDANGDVVATTTTDANGFYAFKDLAPNTEYTVEFPKTVTVEGKTYALTKQGAGDDAKADSNPDPASGQAKVTTPASGANSTEPGKADNPTIDAGYAPVLVSVGDYLWIDADGDGIQGVDEKPVPAGAEVKLLDADGNVLGTTTTDANGFYAFKDLAPNTEYTVEFPKTVTVEGKDYELTAPVQGGDESKDSNPDQATGQAKVTTPATGSNSTEPGKADVPTIDAGYKAKLVSIGNVLWIDANGDGKQDDGESPVPNAEVKLLDANGDVVATTTTDANGFYAFKDLAPNTEYTVEFPTTVTVEGKTYALTKQGAGDDTKADSNPDPASGQAKVTTPATGSNSSDPANVDDPTIDAGYVAVLVSVGDYLWIDADGDGIQGVDEKPVPAGTEVKLLDANGDVVATTTTDANGFYAFKDLAPNTEYTVEFPKTVTVDGQDYELTAAAQGGDESKDSNPDQATGQAKVTTPATGSNSTEPGKADVPTIDAGYKAVPEVKVSIGDYLWIDADGDGIQGADEKPVAGAEVNLLDANGDVVATTTTDANGFYAFKDLAPNTEYTVEFPTTVTVDGKDYVLTGQGKEPGAKDDSDADPATGKAKVTTPATGSNSTEPGKADNPTIDAGYKPAPAKLVSIGNKLWIDANGDGVQDADEKPVAGATVSLRDASGTVVATTTTDANGNYVFTDLTPGAQYTVLFPETVTVDGKSYELTVQGQEAGSDSDSNADPTTGEAKVTAPAKGENSSDPAKVDDPSIDAGYKPLATVKPLVSIGDKLWLDADGNGIQDKGEKPVAGATVVLLDANGEQIATSTTDKNGNYAFTGLDPETKYTVVFPKTVTVDGQLYELTAPNKGAAGADSNPDPTSGKATVTTPANGSNSGEPGKADDPSIDAGYKPVANPTVSIGDKLWLDTNGNGIQDKGEKGVPGATVTLQDVDGNVVATTTTDKDGYYAFTGLNPETKYTVVFPKTVTVDGVTYQLTAPNKGAAGTDSNPDPTSGTATVTTPGNGFNSGEPGKADDPSVDAGYKPVAKPTVSIGDRVWIDANGNGIQDKGEKSVPGVKVELLDKDGKVIDTTTTDKNGNYRFDGLEPGGEYFVKFPTTITVDGKEYPLTTPGKGGDRGADSDADDKGLVKVTAPQKGEDLSFDAGYVPAHEPSIPPTDEPSAEPTEQPTPTPTVEPSAPATSEPTVQPSAPVSSSDSDGGGLVNTGFGVPMWVIALGGLMALLGGALVFSRGRHRH